VLCGQGKKMSRKGGVKTKLTNSEIGMTDKATERLWVCWTCFSPLHILVCMRNGSNCSYTK
jgi:hypothetical protein